MVGKSSSFLESLSLGSGKASISINCLRISRIREGARSHRSSESSGSVEAMTEVSGSSWSGTSSLALTSKNPFTLDQVEGVSSSCSNSSLTSGSSDFSSSSSEPNINPSRELPSVESSLEDSFSLVSCSNESVSVMGSSV